MALARDHAAHIWLDSSASSSGGNSRSSAAAKKKKRLLVFGGPGSSSSSNGNSLISSTTTHHLAPPSAKVLPTKCAVTLSSTTESPATPEWASPVQSFKAYLDQLAPRQPGEPPVSTVLVESRKRSAFSAPLFGGDKTEDSIRPTSPKRKRRTSPKEKRYWSALKSTVRSSSVVASITSSPTKMHSSPSTASEKLSQFDPTAEEEASNDTNNPNQHHPLMTSTTNDLVNDKPNCYISFPSIADD